jgi:hypothetical protein
MTVPGPRSAEQAVACMHAQVVAPSESGPLVHGTHLVGGVHVDVDLMEPAGWCSVAYPMSDPAVAPLLHALIGDDVPEGIPSRSAAHRPSIRLQSTAAPPTASPWLRVAVVDALDRWLHAPLAQSIVDVERGVSRGRAARTLPAGPARAVLTGDALRLTRRAARDFGSFLRRLARHSDPISDVLCSALKDLVDGYSELMDDVAGPDRELKSVLDGWCRLARRTVGTDPPAIVDLPSSSPRGRLHSRIDPRQVPARVVALSGDPTTPEVALEPVADAPDDAVVLVPAFAPAADPDLASRLLVRLVDRDTGEAKAHGVLRAGQYAGESFFEARIPLCGRDVADVRADVVDALSDLPPVSDDSDVDLQNARRAMVFLAEWRRLVGIAQLGVAAASPARRLRDLAARLQPDEAGDPLFPGGPSRAELDELADLGDDELLRRLRGEGSISAGLRALTSGAAGLLVAEVVALLLGPQA